MKYNHFHMLPEQAFKKVGGQIKVYMGGGGSSSQPTNTTVTNTNIPEYAQPYVGNMMNAAQSQIYNKDMTGFNPYVPYSSNPSDYVAAFSPSQQQGFSSIANQQVAPQLTDASNLGYQSGIGGLGAYQNSSALQNTSLGYGSQGNQFAVQNANLANSYAGQGADSATANANLANSYAGAGAQGAFSNADLINAYGGEAFKSGQLGQQLGVQGGAKFGNMGAGFGQDAVGLAGQNIGTGQAGMAAGMSYGQNAQNPNAVQSYMNPYLQNTLTPALQLMDQQYGMQGAQEQGAATSAGAFGGSREALMSGLNQQNRNLAGNQLVSNAYNQAYNTANTNMQQASQLGMQGAQVGLAGLNAANQNYQTGIQGANTGLQGVNTQLAGTAQGMQGASLGMQGANQSGQLMIGGGQLGMQGAQTAGNMGIAGANLGMQGAQTAGNLGIAGSNAGMQGVQGAVGAGQYGLAGLNQANASAGTLGNLGQSQYGQQMGISQAQLSAGAQQQAQQQNVINQAVQNYATAQQYPYMQLGQLNAMLRGLPMQQSSTSMYQAPPSTLSQLGGAGIAGLGATSMYKAATGASGGEVKKMASGGSAIPMSRMSEQQLTQVQQSPASSPLAKINALGLEQLHGYMHNNPQAGQIMQQAPQPVNARSGVAAIGTGDMTQMAGGGIIAFADKGAVEEPTKENVIPRTKEGDLDWASILAPRLSEEQSGKNSVSAAYKPLAATQAEDIKQQRAMLLPELATRFGLGLMGSQGGRGGSLLNRTLQDVGASGLGTLQDMSSKLKDIEAAKKSMQQGTIESTKADQARRDALTGVLAQVYGTEQAKKIGLAQAAATRGAGADAKAAALEANYSQQYSNLYTKAYNLLQNGEMKTHFEVNPAALDQAAAVMAYKAMPQVGRDILKLEAPTPLPVPQAPPVTAPPRSSIFNPTMPPTPAGTMRWDPSANGGKGALVPIQ